METKWDLFYKDSIRKILREKKDILDIGGGLRIVKSNRIDERNSWMLPLIEKVNLKVVDPVPDYKPDIVADIHHLPMKDSSVGGIFCIAVLEHVEDPIRAVAEMYRVLEQDGLVFIYVPFLFYYHAHGDYYKDYWRFTEHSIRHMCKDFSSIEIVSCRYAFETWLKLSPLGRYDFVIQAGRFIDNIFKKNTTKQVSGFYVLARK
jgi:predicted SAM-dependent methyltransferase